MEKCSSTPLRHMNDARGSTVYDRAIRLAKRMPVDHDESLARGDASRINTRPKRQSRHRIGLGGIYWRSLLSRASHLARHN
jgi:hypothetical protein